MDRGRLENTEFRDVRKNGLVGFFDIETYGGLTSDIALIGLKFLDGEYKYFRTAKEFFYYLEKIKEYKILYGFNSGKFDVPVIFDNLYRVGVDFKPRKMFFSGSRLVSATMGKNTILKDILGVFASIRLKDERGRMGLNALAKEFLGIEKEDYNSENIQKVDEELIKYNKRDVEIVEGLFKKVYELSGVLPSTSGKMAISIYEKKFRPDIKQIANRRGIKQFYRGGRSEVFKFEGKNVRLYDVNSMYPYVMVKYPYPIGPVFQEININKEGYSFAIIKAPYNYVPYLPYKAGSKLIFPYGSFSGYYTNFELREAKKRGIEFEVIDGYVCDETEYIFADYVKCFYDLRKKAKEEKNKVLDSYAKLMLNSLYGKFGQSPFIQDLKIKKIENLSRDDVASMVFGNKQKYAIVKKLTFNPFVYYDYIIAGYITAYGRHVLYEYLEKLKPEELFYVDTDGIVSSGDLDNYVGKDLGELKIEGEYEEYHGLLPKVYMLVNKDKTIVKAKGFKNLTPEDILRGKASEKKNSVFGLKEALNRFKSFFIVAEKTRELKSAFEKRVINGNDTEPIKINEGDSEWVD